MYALLAFLYFWGESQTKHTILIPWYAYTEGMWYFISLYVGLNSLKSYLVSVMSCCMLLHACILINWLSTCHYSASHHCCDYVTLICLGVHARWRHMVVMLSVCLSVCYQDFAVLAQK